MKSIFMRVIDRGEYDLETLLKQVDRYHIEGKLTNEEREELYIRARSMPKAQYNYSEEIQKLWAALRKLGKEIHKSEDVPPSSVEEYPEYVQPTGAHDAYQTGDQVTFKGERYSCLMDNCVWAPDVLPSAWEICN